MDGYFFSFDFGKVQLVLLVLLECGLEVVLVEIRLSARSDNQSNLQAEEFLCNLLILALYAFKLCFACVEMQRLCFEFDGVDRLALRHGLSDSGSMLSRGDLDELFEKLLVI